MDAQYQQFVASTIGRTDVGDTSGNHGQCVGLAEVWNDQLRLPHIWGDAWAMPDNADPNFFIVVTYVPGYRPPNYCLAVFPKGWGGSPVGHVAIVDPQTTAGRLWVLEANDKIGGGNGSVRRYNFAYPAGMKFIIPKSFNASGQGEEVITDSPNEFARWSKLFQEIRGRVPSHDEFVQAAVGQTWLRAIEILSDNEEADATQHAQEVGQVAVRDNWEQQIYGLQDQLKTAQGEIADLKKQLTDAQNKPITDEQAAAVVATKVEPALTFWDKVLKALGRK